MNEKLDLSDVMLVIMCVIVVVVVLGTAWILVQRSLLV